MAQSIQELQRGAVVRMLDLGGNPGSEQSWGGAQTWKVLVYDKFCQQVMAPLLKVGALRSHGVTLYLTLDSERLPVGDVPAVYFVEPTADNIARIIKDLDSGLYPSCYINFASAVPRALLEDMARGVLKANGAQKVAGVFDRYVSFVSLGPTLFSLNLPGAYETIHNPSIADDLMMAYIERIVDGLLSVLISLRVLPIIRCPPNYAAEMVSKRLEERIRELLARGGSAAADLFSSAAVGAARGPGADPAASQRPLLCILDRDVDLVTMLNHTWTYQAMVHDVLGMRLNKLTVPVENAGDSATPPKPKSYDVDDGDSFWVAHAGEPFPAVAQAVNAAFEEFNRRRESMARTDGDDPAASLAQTSSAISALPEMSEKKRIVDMHTNIATALLNEVKARELDNYYQMEDQFSSQSLGTSVSQLEQLLGDKQRGTVLDKTRALMVLYLTKPSISSTQLQGLIDALQGNNGGDLVAGLEYLKHLGSIRNMMVPNLVAGGGGSGSAGPGSLMGGTIGSLANSFMSNSQNILAAGMSGIKNILPSKKELVVCQVLDGLMDQKPTGITENYLYLDPKAHVSAAASGEAPRVRAPFRRALTFVVGGGNYAEMQSVQEWATAHGRHVTYGSTDIVSPAQFVEELCRLGQAQCGASDLR